jgi:hypothetical protein
LGRLRQHLAGTGYSVPHPDAQGYRLRRAPDAERGASELDWA